MTRSLARGRALARVLLVLSMLTVLTAAVIGLMSLC